VDEGSGDQVNQMEFTVSGDNLSITSASENLASAGFSDSTLLDSNTLALGFSDSLNSDLGTGQLFAEQQFNGESGGAVPEFSTPLIIFLVAGVSLVVFFVVRQRFAVNKK
jgi:hypothetical protein